MSDELDNVIVKKCWGWESKVFSNKHLAIWLLHINGGEETSFHAHVKKNTGLCVLSGIIKVSFINNSVVIKGLDKLQIFTGRFHSTKALSKNGAVVLEIEQPEDKYDLVRFSDKYGRENQKYEGKENYLPKNDNCLELKEEQKSYFYYGRRLEIENITNKKQLMGRDFEEVLVVLEGGIVSLDNQLVCPPGNVASAHNFDFLLQKFDIAPGTKILSIS